MTASQRQTLAAEAITEHGLSERQACRLLGISRTGYRYVPKRPDDSAIVARLQEPAEFKPRWGVGQDGPPAASGWVWLEPQAD